MAEHEGVEGGFDPVLTLNLKNRPAQPGGDGEERRKGWCCTNLAKAVQQTPEDPLLSAPMDVRIMAVQVAQARLEAMSFRFEDEKIVRLVPCQGVSHAQLEGHVETWNAEGTREANPAQVVNRGTATRDQVIDAVQTIAAGTRKLQNTTWLRAKGSHPCDEGDEEWPVPRIEGEIQENRLPGTEG